MFEKAGIKLLPLSGVFEGSERGDPCDGWWCMAR